MNSSVQYLATPSKTARGVLVQLNHKISCAQRWRPMKEKESKSYTLYYYNSLRVGGSKRLYQGIVASADVWNSLCLSIFPPASQNIIM
jgi:hypothetical protein